MEQQSYIAAYVPDVERRSFDDALKPAIQWIEERCDEAGSTAVVITPQKPTGAYPDNLQALIARHGAHVSPRSQYRQGVTPGVPTLVYMPDEQMLEMAAYYARGSAVCAVESFDFPLRGWAAALGAINLDTGEVELAPPDDVVELLDHIVWMGNNGYGDKYTKGSIGTWIDKLAAAAPEIDGAFVAGWVLAKGRSDSGAKNIRALVDRRR